MSEPERIPAADWITVDFRPTPAPVVVKDKSLKDKLQAWQCLYLTGMRNTPFIGVEMAGWLVQRYGDKVRVVAAICLSGTVHPWDGMEIIRITNGVHTARIPWCVVPPGDLPSKHSARQRWQEIQGSIIIEGSQE